jgi:hypothetical protein
VILNKAMSLVVVASALPFRASAVPFSALIAYWSIIANLLCGSLLGAWLGAGWATRLASQSLYRVIAILLVGITGVLLLPCSNSPKAISNIATSWARFARDGNGSKRAELCYPGAGGTRRGHDRRAAYSTARLAACGGRSRPAVFGGLGVFCPPVKIGPQRSQA